MTKDDYIVVLITASSPEEARKISQELIAHKVAACINSAPVHSVFRWKGKTERAKETLLIVKSRMALFEQLEAVVKRNHSYEVPEIIALPIVAGSSEYLKWVKETTEQ
ncbi:MAG: divalent-cation tolerance protein CutA [Candidatus Omnitrophica bacterium]|nr:divalent-cation tolerance protein CutA [Candidatus Omnitrophota bacterium]MBU4477492.1 divalent-cation tolerance protein CutA [Candidatus Omnitrophota bacterium]